MLGTTENELGIRKWIEDQGHELITTSNKEGENSEFDKHLVDAEVIITTPYVPPPEATPQCTLLRPTRHFGRGTLANLAAVTCANEASGSTPDTSQKSVSPRLRT
jgi:hypothetical protein